MSDLAAEQAVVRDLVERIGVATWLRPTPAAGWTVVDQVNHLAWTDERARLAVEDPDRFVAVAEEDLAAPRFDDMVRRWGRRLRTEELLGWYDTVRAALRGALQASDLEHRVPWYGPPMRVRTLVGARIMETWAHGRDIATALGRAHLPTERLWYVCDLGVRTRRWSFDVHGLVVPDAEIAVQLGAPGGAGTWSWGSSGATQSVIGEAEDFALVVTQRRNVADTGLVVTGPDAAHWMECAQAFAGVPTGPPPRS